MKYPSEPLVITIMFDPSRVDTTINVQGLAPWGLIRDLPVSKALALRNLLGAWYLQMHEIHGIKAEIESLIK